MRKRRNILTSCAFLAFTSWMAIACTAGTGALAVFEDPYDRPPDTRDKPIDTRDNPTLSGRDTPPGAIENPGTLGGGPAGPGGGCPPCDGTFKCTAVVQNQTASTSIVLKTVGGQCVAIDDKGKTTSTLACGGTVIDAEDGNVGTWQASGDGFVATGTGKSTTTTSDGNKTTTTFTVTTTCTRESNSTTPIPKPTSTGTAGGTGTTPTGTATVPPPTIVDAGSKG